MKKKAKRLFLTVLAMCLALVFVCSGGSMAMAKSFSDVPVSHWGYSVINDLSNKDILNGYTDGSFKPSATMSNAEFVSLITKAYCVRNGRALPAAPGSGQAWYTPAINAAVSYKIISSGQFTGKENSPISRRDMALLVANASPDLAAPANLTTALSRFSDAAEIQKLSSSYQNAIAKLGVAGIVSGDSDKAFKPNNNMSRAEAASIVANYLKQSAPAAEVESGAIMIAAAASLQNVFEKSLIPEFNKLYPQVKVTGTYDSSGKLQTQIESGLEADIFFSAATKQMDALKTSGLIDGSTIVNLLENKVVLIGTKGVPTKVTSFSNITDANIIAVGDPASVPAGQYAQEVFTSLGNWDAVLKKSSLGTNVTEVLNWVAAGSAEVGVVYATDAASNSNVTVIAEAPAGSLKQPVLYPIGITSRCSQKAQAEAFINFLKTPTAKGIFESYGFTVNN